MLEMTPAASTVVRTLIDQSSEVDDGGLRIDAGGPEGADFAVSIAGEPADGDAVVESDGARVFLGEEAASVLDDKLLDAEVDEVGSVRFALTDRD